MQIEKYIADKITSLCEKRDTARQPTAANTTSTVWLPDYPQAAKRRPTQRRFCRSAGRTGLENLRGRMAMHTRIFKNTMCKSHKLHCFSKPLLEKALTARRRRVIVTGPCAEGIYPAFGLFAFFPAHSSCSLSSDARQAGGRGFERSIRISSPPAPTPASPAA